MTPADAARTKDNADDEVKIFSPDTSLQNKIGPDIDTVLSPQAVAAAQVVITQSEDTFLEESFVQLERLVVCNKTIQASPKTALQSIPSMIDIAFSLRSQTGVAGYQLVSALSKSLYLHCELLKSDLSTRDLNLIQWHVATIQQLLKGKMKGNGGDLGKVILAEIEKLRVTGNVTA